MITQVKNIPQWAEGSPLLSFNRQVAVVGIPLKPPTYGELVSVIMGAEAPLARKAKHSFRQEDTGNPYNGGEAGTDENMEGYEKA